MSSFSLDNIQKKKFRVGDIDIASCSYQVFSDNVCVGSCYVRQGIFKSYNNRFRYRGIGKTTVGSKTWSIEQFANDTAGLIDALGIKKPVDILGLSSLR